MDSGLDPQWLPEPDREFLSARYRLVREVARGSMGVVFEGVHLGLDKKVAVKIIRADPASHRFEREGRLLARVQSPNVVRVLDFEVLSTGQPMLVMEWVDGTDLARKIEERGGEIPESELLPWIRNACHGMQAVEREHIVHRDLKPANILLDRKGHAFITDFGLARPDLADAADTLSSDGSLLGTPLYMAPEQAEHPRSADTRSDIYSFGATFYHALTGEPPFPGDSLFEILLKHKTEPLVSPRARCRSVTDHTNDVIERCLAKNPNDRFQSFDELQMHLEPVDRDSSPWDETDDRGLDRYLVQYRAGRERYFEKRAGPELLQFFRFPGGRTLEILAGDITTLGTDAIVSSDDYRLTMGGGVSNAILKAAGPGLLDEAAVYVPVRPGRAVVTSAGDLPRGRFVFHGISMGVRDGTYLEPSRDLIIEIIRSCLYHAETLNVKSIAFPLVGTGAGGFPPDVCLDITFLTLARALHRGITPVEHAYIVIKTP